jgi:multiple sugar transport system ATP-binding protein
MDEPLSNLDAKLRLYMRAELKRLQKDLGVTTVYVTHDQAEAMALADQIAVMNHAKVQQYDTPFKIYNKPANVFVAGFIGSPPMNLIKSTVNENNGQITLDSGALRYALPDYLSASVRGKFSGSEAVWGVAPEDLKIHLLKTPDAIFEAEVYVIEPIGHSILIDLKVDDFLMKAISPPVNGLDTAHKVWVSFDSSSTHVFDGKTENLII